MNLPLAKLRKIYEDQSQIILNDINAGQMKLIFDDPVALTTVSSNFAEEPKNISRYGGRMPTDSLNDRVGEITDNTQPKSIEQDIKCRTYWENKKMDQVANLVSPVDRCKVIAESKHQDRINEASLAIIDGQKCKREGFAVARGLFGKQYCTSYWVAI